MLRQTLLICRNEKHYIVRVIVSMFTYRKIWEDFLLLQEEPNTSGLHNGCIRSVICNQYCLFRAEILDEKDSI